MPTRKKATTTDAPDTTSIRDACQQLNTTEQALRLALSHIRPDDFDTTKTLSSLDIEAVSKHLQQPQLPVQATKELQEPEPADKSKNQTQQDSQAATEPTTNAPSGVLAEQQSHNSNSDISRSQSPLPKNQVSLVEMLARQATEEIEAIDGLARVKNAVIINNLQARDAELAQQIQERHSDRQHQIMGSIRDVAALAQDKPEVSSDDSNLTAEIDDLINQLGKSLVQ